MNEPTVACISYGLEQLNEGNNVLVFKMGSSKLNISILNVQSNSFRIKTSVNDENLGGDGLDNELVKYCIKKFKEKSGIDINELDEEKKKQIFYKLKHQCERHKIFLSKYEYVPFTMNDLVNGKGLKLTIKRKEFENICKQLFEECIKLVEKALDSSGLTKNEIDRIIMSGGCSSIPKFKK